MKVKIKSAVDEQKWKVFVRGSFCTACFFPREMSEREVRTRLQVGAAIDVKLQRVR